MCPPLSCPTLPVEFRVYHEWGDRVEQDLRKGKADLAQVGAKIV